MRKLMKGALALAACLAVGTAAYAVVVIDEDGYGFVGKGDIQDLFGWNDATLQANASALSFVFTSSEATSWDCEWYTGPDRNRTRHTVERSTVQDVSTSIAYDARKNKNGKITGFNLNGFGAPTVSGGGTVGACEAEKTFVEGSLATTVTDEGTLYVKYGDELIPLPIPVDQAEDQ